MQLYNVPQPVIALWKAYLWEAVEVVTLQIHVNHSRRYLMSHESQNFLLYEDLEVGSAAIADFHHWNSSEIILTVLFFISYEY